MLPLDILSSEHISVATAVAWALTSFLCWCLVYYFCSLAANGSQFLLECLSCCMRALHAVGAIVFTMIATEHRPHPFIEIGEDNIPLHNLVLIWSLGFFMLECALASVVKKEPSLMVAHHYASVLVLGTALLIQEGGAEMMVGILMLESTNPLFQVRQILRLTKYKNGRFYKIVEWSFLIFFTLIRVIPCGITTLFVLFDPSSQLHIQITYSTFYSISLVMVYYTLAYMVNKYFKKAKSS
ncbi:TLC domain-containing protein 5-like [Macrosteles quadrilineatus]|uniref:TLC domain-containing protein 5-like n=1 Tax=Macrosteles quadrilineatus TaxID=74068 RepID=UPI0023E267CE|nr:TLC domain-containing protein 5-like [Macrosteles quadrilineatus]XP_054264941.1 TLC domain-containing protein 5-like [Macrosteles quadrilineatus]XP_054264942.1 TLC domain-containing protein 5-like [Macrosteles quadrilineatus]